MKGSPVRVRASAQMKAPLRRGFLFGHRAPDRKGATSSRRRKLLSHVRSRSGRSRRRPPGPDPPALTPISSKRDSHAPPATDRTRRRSRMPGRRSPETPKGPGAEHRSNLDPHPGGFRRKFRAFRPAAPRRKRQAALYEPDAHPHRQAPTPHYCSTDCPNRPHPGGLRLRLVRHRNAPTKPHRLTKSRSSP